MFAIGHIALGYLFGKGSSELLHVKINLPLLFAASVLPDIDLLFRFLTHRGPTHSLITIIVFMVPFFILYRKQVIPYFVALLTHILIGDFVTGGVELFWPLSRNMIGVLNFEVNSLPIAATELMLFLIALPLMYKLGDLQNLLRPNNRNWALIIPAGAILGPLLSFGREQESHLPILLIVPSLIFLAIFGYSLFIWFKFKWKANFPQSNNKSNAQPPN